MVCGGCKDKKDAISYTKVAVSSISRHGERRSVFTPINIKSIIDEDGKRVTVTRR